MAFPLFKKRLIFYVKFRHSKLSRFDPFNHFCLRMFVNNVPTSSCYHELLSLVKWWIGESFLWAGVAGGKSHAIMRKDGSHPWTHTVPISPPCSGPPWFPGPHRTAMLANSFTVSKKCFPSGTLKPSLWLVDSGGEIWVQEPHTPRPRCSLGLLLNPSPVPLSKFSTSFSFLPFHPHLFLLPLCSFSLLLDSLTTRYI